MYYVNSIAQGIKLVLISLCSTLNKSSIDIKVNLSQYNDGNNHKIANVNPLCMHNNFNRIKWLDQKRSENIAYNVYRLALKYDFKYA